MLKYSTYSNTWPHKLRSRNLIELEASLDYGGGVFRPSCCGLWKGQDSRLLQRGPLLLNNGNQLKEFPSWPWMSIDMSVRPYEEFNSAEPIFKILDIQFPPDSSFIASHRWLKTLPSGIVRMRDHLFSGFPSVMTQFLRGEA